ncbi:MAG: sulfurtransferase-like selenium metabolism protein YedF [Oscillospiraceae bacterium]|nr:sulfurtransferase-like selenium metabolism protein YedF [Oscillospiraceae bacterium]
MKIIDALGKPCPVPVIESKKALAENGADSVSVKVDNFAAVQNLEKMAKGYGYEFSYVEKAADSYEVAISKGGKERPHEISSDNTTSNVLQNGTASSGLAVVIGRDTMGKGADELGKILVKGFIYSLTELPTPPKHVIFFNSGVFLTSAESNTIDDLKKLEEKGVEVLICGTCVNFYNLQDKLAVGAIVNMYEIAERMALASKTINI